jgi:hypothetical protein
VEFPNLPSNPTIADLAEGHRSLHICLEAKTAELKMLATTNLGNIRILQVDMATTKSDVKDIKTDIAYAKPYVTGLKSSIDWLLKGVSVVVLGLISGIALNAYNANELAKKTAAAAATLHAATNEAAGNRQQQLDAQMQAIFDNQAALLAALKAHDKVLNEIKTHQ